MDWPAFASSPYRLDSCPLPPLLTLSRGIASPQTVSGGNRGGRKRFVRLLSGWDACLEDHEGPLRLLGPRGLTCVAVCMGQDREITHE